MSEIYLRPEQHFFDVTARYADIEFDAITAAIGQEVVLQSIAEFNQITAYPDIQEGQYTDLPEIPATYAYDIARHDFVREVSPVFGDVDGYKLDYAAAGFLLIRKELDNSDGKFQHAVSINAQMQPDGEVIIHKKENWLTTTPGPAPIHYLEVTEADRVILAKAVRRLEIVNCAFEK